MFTKTRYRKLNSVFEFNYKKLDIHTYNYLDNILEKYYRFSKMVKSFI